MNYRTQECSRWVTWQGLVSMSVKFLGHPGFGGHGLIQTAIPGAVKTPLYTLKMINKSVVISICTCSRGDLTTSTSTCVFHWLFTLTFMVPFSPLSFITPFGYTVQSEILAQRIVYLFQTHWTSAARAGWGNRNRSELMNDIYNWQFDWVVCSQSSGSCCSLVFRFYFWLISHGSRTRVRLLNNLMRWSSVFLFYFSLWTLLRENRMSSGSQGSITRFTHGVPARAQLKAAQGLYGRWEILLFLFT